MLFVPMFAAFHHPRPWHLLQELRGVLRRKLEERLGCTSSTARKTCLAQLSQVASTALAKPQAEHDIQIAYPKLLAQHKGIIVCAKLPNRCGRVEKVMTNQHSNAATLSFSAICHTG